MRYRTYQECKEQKLGDVKFGCARYQCGTCTMRKMAQEANAVVKIGKSWRFNIAIMDAYIDGISE